MQILPYIIIIGIIVTAIIFMPSGIVGLPNARRHEKFKKGLKNIGFVPSYTTEDVCSPMIAVNTTEKKIAFIYTNGASKTYNSDDLRNFNLKWDEKVLGFAKRKVYSNVILEVTVNDFNNPFIKCDFDYDLETAQNWQAKLDLMVNG